jgi:hypothetical protein
MASAPKSVQGVFSTGSKARNSREYCKTLSPVFLGATILLPLSQTLSLSLRLVHFSLEHSEECIENTGYSVITQIGKGKIFLF